MSIELAGTSRASGRPLGPLALVVLPPHAPLVHAGLPGQSRDSCEGAHPRGRGDPLRRERSAGIRIHCDIAGLQPRSRVEGRPRVHVRIGWGGHSDWQTVARPAPWAAARPTWSARFVQQRQSRQPAPQRSRLEVVRACVRACVPFASVHRIGREGAALVASRLVGLVGLVDVLWRGSRQSPSRRPRQWEQLQWPVRVHLCGGGAITTTDGGGSGARAASGAWETGAPASLLEPLSPQRASPSLLSLCPLCRPFLPIFQTDGAANERN